MANTLLRAGCCCGTVRDCPSCLTETTPKSFDAVVSGTPVAETGCRLVDIPTVPFADFHHDPPDWYQTHVANPVLDLQPTFRLRQYDWWEGTGYEGDPCIYSATEVGTLTFDSWPDPPNSDCTGDYEALVFKLLALLTIGNDTGPSMMVWGYLYEEDANWRWNQVQDAPYVFSDALGYDDDPADCSDTLTFTSRGFWGLWRPFEGGDHTITVTANMP